MKILAIDPGITTGIATYDTATDQYSTCVIPKQFTTVYRFIQGVHWDLVLLEGFSTPGRISSHGIDTVELIGGVKAICWSLDIECIVQYPIARRGSLPEAARILKEVLHKKHYPEHELDALSHIVAYYRREPNK